jgi:hypothetical protein
MSPVALAAPTALDIGVVARTRTLFRGQEVFG